MAKISIEYPYEAKEPQLIPSSPFYFLAGKVTLLLEPIPDPDPDPDPDPTPDKKAAPWKSAGTIWGPDRTIGKP